MPFLSPTARATAWPSVIPISSTVWWASTCRSPFAWISRSSIPCRATWSSMWSRNGIPVESAARPLPSTLTDSAICVSWVLRSALAARVGISASFRQIAYTKSAFGERLRERGETARVLIRRSDGEPHAALEERHPGVEVLDEHAAASHAFEHRSSVGDAHQDEVRVAGKDRRARKLAQLGVETLPLGDDTSRLRVEHVVVREDALGDHMRERIDVVGRAHLVEFSDPLRPAHRITEPYSGETELRQRAHDDQVGELGKPRHERFARKGVVRLVDHDQPGSGREDALDRLFVEEISAGVVRI